MLFQYIPFPNFWKRLLWRWITPPKLDFWPCWIGMLLPVCISVWYILFDWKLLVQKPWFNWLFFFWIWSAVAFVFRWTTAPKHKDSWRSLIGASGINRCLAFLAFVLANTKFFSFFAFFVIFMIWCVVASMFEEAYERTLTRLTPEGISAYEAKLPNSIA